MAASIRTYEAVNTVKHSDDKLSLALSVKTPCVRQYSRVSRDFHNKYTFP